MSSVMSTLPPAPHSSRPSSKTSNPAPLSALPSWAARLALGALERLDQGVLHLELPDGSSRLYGRGEHSAALHIRDWAVFDRLLRGGDIGFAEAFLDGQWDTPDLSGLLALLAANRDALDAPLYGSLAGRIMHRLVHLLRANTRSGSRRNIAAHYDLGNDFYSLWLDAGMTYSSAIFSSKSQSLEDAQAAKYQRVLDALQPEPGSRILEIGCGWGAFAERAASAGHHVTGVSLSRRQLEYATSRIERAGLAERAQFEFRDYRDLSGQYDAVASIEMVEAVGERWWPTYFTRIAAALAPGGRAVVQSILIEDNLFDRYRRGSDFIQKYIFPGGMLPSGKRFKELAEHAGLSVVDDFRFGPDYARTLELWRESFTEKLDAVRALGFDERFLRMWHFYYAYCEAGFNSGSTDVAQFTLVKK